MNIIKSYTAPSISKLAIPLLIALAWIPLTVSAAMVAPVLDPADSFGARNDSSSPFIFLMGAGRMEASGQFAQFSGQAVRVRNGSGMRDRNNRRNANSRDYRQPGRSSALDTSSLFAGNIIADRKINLDTPANVQCSSAIVEDCVTGTNFADAQTAVPVPAALWLFASGLLGVIGMARRRSSAAA